VCEGAEAVLADVPSPKFHRYVNESSFGSDDPALDRLHVLATHEGVPMVGTGASLSPGSWMPTTFVVWADLPHASVTVNVTVKSPSAVYMRVGETDADVPPSPNSHAYVSVPPLGSDEPVAKNAHVRAVQLGPPITGVGATLSPGSSMPTVRVAVDDLPQPSVAVNVTV
jgi:hypothetical protein